MGKARKEKTKQEGMCRLKDMGQSWRICDFPCGDCVGRGDELLSRKVPGLLLLALYLDTDAIQSPTFLQTVRTAQC